MARKRLINVDFLTTSFMGVSNKAKLLYMVMIFYADDLGFVGNTFKLVEELDKTETEYENVVSLELVGNSYINALHDLDHKGYIYTFVDNHGNHIHLIRHWFVHNRWIKGLTTNYKRFLKEVELVDDKWVKKSDTKEIKSNKPNQIKTNDDKEISKEEWDKLFNGVGEDKTDTETDEDLPF